VKAGGWLFGDGWRNGQCLRLYTWQATIYQHTDAYSGIGGLTHLCMTVPQIASGFFSV